MSPLSKKALKVYSVRQLLQFVIVTSILIKSVCCVDNLDQQVASSSSSNQQQTSDDTSGQHVISSHDEFPINPPDIPTDATQVVKEKKYGVIVDCGSSGSRAHIFHWDSTDKRESLGQVEAMPDEEGRPLSYKKTPGLSSISSNAEAIQYIAPLIAFVKENVPANRLAHTSVYFLATAGMRLLDEEKQLDTMNTIGDYMRSYHGFTNIRSRIITGWEEGLYQWITMKTLTKNYNKPNFGFKQALGDNNIDGIIEMGGASLQVAFAADSEAIARIDKYVKGPVKSLLQAREVSRKGKIKGQMGVVSVSFLGLGSNSIRETATDVMLHSAVKEAIRKIGIKPKNPSDEYKIRKAYLKTFTGGQQFYLKDPCTPRGLQYSIKKLQAVGNPDYLRESSLAGWMKDEFEVLVVGQGNGVACRKHLHDLIDQILEKRFNCPTVGPCANELLRSLFVPFGQQKFIALGDFYYPLELIESTGQINLIEAYRRAEKLCNKDYNQLEQEYPHANDYDSKRLRNQCFKSLWGLTFLEYGLRLSPLDSGNVRVVKNLNAKQLDWTLGAIVSNYENMETYA